MVYDAYFRNLSPLTEDALSEELKAYQLSLVSFGNFKAKGARSVRNMALPYHRVIYVTGSSVRYQIHENFMILEKGDVLYTPPNTIYSAASLEEDRLLRKKMTITQVARELGFANPNHFSNAFYKVMGKRPSSFSE